jgi:hypothetical protein
MSRLPLTRLAELEQLLPDAGRQYHRLVLVVGPVGSGKTPLLRALCHQQDIPYVNVNLALSQRLLDLTSRERPLRVRRLLEDVVGGQPGDIVVLDNVELLFDPALRQDPLACLQALSRNRTLVASWGGAYTQNVLTYAEPGHPEHRRYERPDATVIALP